MRSFKIIFGFISVVLLVISAYVAKNVEYLAVVEGVQNLAIINISIAIGLGALSLNIKSTREKKSVIRSVLYIIIFGVLTQVFSMLSSSIRASDLEDLMRMYILFNTTVISILMYGVGINLIESLNKKVPSSYEAETVDNFY
ncbi:hypothetical protein [Alkalicoccobacillus plakortidis]|uniref:Uncharacterized protein n=1 Tax=Alkalicoccobacillus plakortidis TaxID=444060 RepID=A0ABT0XI39_9BACI|nr:hypothetical protein [Alkalicoccobacillus plakortidis]MCM2675563.1 hypothetical protein [Alkalicoccobacillus plakortidis]